MKRSVIRIAIVALLASALASCSRSTHSTSPVVGESLERVTGTLLERNTEQMTYDGPLVLVIQSRPGLRVNAVIPGSLRGNSTPQERVVAETAFRLPLGSHVVALGKRESNGDLSVRELRGGF